MYFAHVTALQTSAFSIGFGSMQRDLGMSDLQAAAGVALYGWVRLSGLEKWVGLMAGLCYWTTMLGTDI